VKKKSSLKTSPLPPSYGFTEEPFDGSAGGDESRPSLLLPPRRVEDEKEAAETWNAMISMDSESAAAARLREATAREQARQELERRSFREKNKRVVSGAPLPEDSVAAAPARNSAVPSEAAEDDLQSLSSAASSAATPSNAGTPNSTASNSNNNSASNLSASDSKGKGVKKPFLKSNFVENLSSKYRFVDDSFADDSKK
jgi:hypothetical protein